MFSFRRAEADPQSASAIPDHVIERPRRGSVMSLSQTLYSLDSTPPPPADLEQIHASSSQAPGLTSFSLASPPSGSTEQLSFNNLYSRVKRVASAVRDVVGVPVRDGASRMSLGSIGSDRYQGHADSRDSFMSSATIDSEDSNYPALPTSPLSPIKSQFGKHSRITSSSSLQSSSRVSSNNSMASTAMAGDYAPPAALRKVNLRASNSGAPVPSLAPITVFRDGDGSEFVSLTSPGLGVKGMSDVSRKDNEANLQNSAKEKAVGVQRSTVNALLGAAGTVVGGTVGYPPLPVIKTTEDESGVRAENDEEPNSSASEEDEGAISDSSADDIVLLNSRLPGGHDGAKIGTYGSKAIKVAGSSSENQPVSVQRSSSKDIPAPLNINNSNHLPPSTTGSDVASGTSLESNAASFVNNRLQSPGTSPSAIKSAMNLTVPKGDRNSPSSNQRADVLGKLSLPPSNPPMAGNGETVRKQRPTVSRISTDQASLLPGFPVTREASSESGSSQDATSTADVGKRSGGSSMYQYREGLQDGMVNGGNTGPNGGVGTGNSEAVNQALRQLRMGNLTSDFWMKDELCKECFLCANTFGVFRRKHHCRLCGQIFCSKCTTLISGDRFQHQGSMRVCSPCLEIVNEYQDESESEDDFSPASVFHIHQPIDQRHEMQSGPGSVVGTPIGGPMTPGFSMPRESRPATTPLMAIPASRITAGSNPNRRSQILEINAEIPSPPRPPSSRSGKSPMSSLNIATHTPIRIITNTNIPARIDALPAFHSDSIIDPDLAPYMSDDASDDEQMSIFATIAPKYGEAFGNLFSTSVTGSQSGQAGSISLGLNGAASTMSKIRRAASINGINALLNAGGSDNGKSGLLPPTRSSRKRNSSFLGNIQPRPVTRGKGHRNLMRSLVGSVSDASAFGGAGSSAMPSPRASRSASMRGPLAPSIELNTASLQHVRTLLRQLLGDANIKEVDKWERALMPILLKSTDDLNPDIRSGDIIDIRHYVKVKKIPGGKPGDTTYVSGVVFTKNLALKSMPRNISHPRIVVVTFPIEYQRHQQQLMSLEPVIAQEKDYLQKMVARITSLRPTLLLVEKNISGVALQLLAQANVATTHLVKPSVIEAVARCAGADICSSVDKLLLHNFRVGRCASFDVKTFVHEDIPERKKTFMYLSGCPKELGCTIVLRGGDMETLAVLKQITEMMIYVVYNLKLETCLMRDEFVNIPSSSSIAPAPTASGRMAGGLPDDIPSPTYYEDMVKNHETKVLSASPFVKYMQPYLLMRARELERKLVYLKRLRDIGELEEHVENEKSVDPDKPVEKFELIQPEMVDANVKNGTKKMVEVLRAIHDAEYDKALHVYETQKKQWENYLSQYDDLFDPYTHQNIAILYSLVCTLTTVPCEGPELRRLEFYFQGMDWPLGKSDCTLGQYVELLCDTANKRCESDTCDKKMIDHHRSYVHGQARVSVLVSDKMACPIQGMQDTILMWSYCKVCPNTNTPAIPMSESTWKYSFGKYLELAFWSSEMKLRAGNCPHDLNREHVRCFGYRGLTVVFQYDPIDLLEIVVPRTKITYNPETDLRIKNEQYLQHEERTDRFFSSVKSRLKSINIESVPADKIDACKAEIETLTTQAENEHSWLIKKLQEKYNKSKYFEIIPLNRALRALQERVVDWDARFNAFDNNYFPSEKDIRRLATLQLKKIFIDNPSTPNLQPDERTPTPEKDIGKATSIVDGSAEMVTSPTEMSSKQAHDVLASVVEEDIENNKGKSAKNEKEDSMEDNEAPPLNRTQSTPHVPQRKGSDGVPLGLRPLTHTPSFPLKKPSVTEAIRKHNAEKAKSGKGPEKFRFASLNKKPPQLRDTQIPRSVPTQRRKDNKVTAIAKQIEQLEQLSREFEKERVREKRLSAAKRTRALPVATSRPIVEVYRNVAEAVEEVSDEEPPEPMPPSRETSNMTVSTESTIQTESPEDDGEISFSSDHEANIQPPIIDVLPPNPDTPLIQKHEKSAWTKMLSNFWAERSASGWSSLEYPLHPTDHVFNDSDVIVREDEPSSLIAFALNCEDYASKLDAIRSADVGPTSSEDCARPTAFNVDEHPELERSLLRTTGTHLKYQFQEGSAKMFCKIFFAEQFDALRRNCGVADRYVESLSRCIKWDSKGGKTKSVFLKTQDERFVLKALSPIETAAFIKFAPAYFQFMAEAFFHELPTVIAKMLGFYQIMIKNPTTGIEIKWDVLVMENLFYDRKTTRIFDLKGSMRNRYMQSTGDQNEVLLDENMIEFIYESPLFVREHSKKLLRASVWNDTLFLSRQNVMDYSLMIGIDEVRKELCVGIIGAYNPLMQEALIMLGSLV
ncbi:hypothetical protein DFP73DRAFT_477973 [Morchella snyderi]|nr:hypothetical protein DFP73DRAFT_477973 [Morchella snyderi]